MVLNALNVDILKKTFRVNSESIGYFDIKEWNNSLAVFETKVKTSFEHTW